MINLHSPEINEIAKALANAQSELGGTEKDGKNPHFKSAYSTLQACISVIREPLAKNGLCLTQQYMEIEGKPYLVTMLSHTSGQYYKSIAPLLLDKFTSQAIGSATSYMRRYSLCAMLGLYQEDDDAEAAMSRKAKAVPELGDEEFDEFVAEWRDVYTDNVLQGYFKAKGTKYKKTPKQIAFEAKKDLDMFKREMESYLTYLQKIGNPNGKSA